MNLGQSLTVNVPSPKSAFLRARTGLSVWAVFGGIAGVSATVAVLGIKLFPGLGGDTTPPHLLAVATRGPFVHEVWERGELESSSNIEVRCEVKSQNSAGINIIEIVPEGTLVNAGDFLVKLDDSALQTQMILQEIQCSNSESEAVDAEATLEASRLELLEYEKGAFVQEEEQLQSEVFVAEENVRRAEEYLGFSQTMSQRGYVSAVQLEADRFAVEKARKELDVSKTKLGVLQTYTKTKQLTLLTAAIKTAEGRLKAKKRAYDLDDHRLAEINDQIAKCTILAPSAGQVVYANDPTRRGSSGDLPVAEGQPVRERQVIIRLPDQSRMSVVAKVHESRINYLQPGMDAVVTLDAYPDDKLRGKVVSIGEFPLPNYNIYMAHVKEYAVSVDIKTSLPNLRPGMSAEVRVFIDRLDDVVQIPVHAAIERAGRFFCAVPLPDGKFETREIQVGPLSEETIVVTSGLEAGESVTLRFPELESRMNLPEPLVAGEADLPETETGAQ